eukprot:jgi/Botrbrau1/2991/Bobra.0026s0051.1
MVFTMFHLADGPIGPVTRRIETMPLIFAVNIMSSNGQPGLAVYPLTHYKFGKKDAKGFKSESQEGHFERLKSMYKQEGLRRSAFAVMLVNQHHFPHLLLFKRQDGSFALPGGKLKPGEDEVEGLKRKLAGKLSPETPSLITEWEVGECVASFWRPYHTPPVYPYVPAHITNPKEVVKLFAVPLPERCYFAVPEEWELIAVPMHELYHSVDRFGPYIAVIPDALSRFRITLVD